MENTKTKQRAAILAAAKSGYLAKGFDGMGMKDIAISANVARSTVYRYFSGRDALLIAVIKQEMEALNERIQTQQAQLHRPQDLVVEGMILAIKEIPKRPLLGAIFASEQDSRARQLVWRSNVIVQFGEELMEHVIRPAHDAGILQEAVRPEILVEWIYRVLLSFLTLPSNWVRTDAQLRTTLHALLIPVLLKPEPQ